MAQPISKTGVRAIEFPGLFSNRGPLAPIGRPATAAGQTNLCCRRLGELEARPGMRPVQYDADAVVAPPGLAGGRFWMPFFRYRAGA